MSCLESLRHHILVNVGTARCKRGEGINTEAHFYVSSTVPVELGSDTQWLSHTGGQLESPYSLQYECLMRSLKLSRTGISDLFYKPPHNEYFI